MYKKINYSYPNTDPMDIACTYAARKYLTGNESTKIYTSADDNNGKYIYGLYLIPEDVASVVNGVEYDSEGNVVIPPDQCRAILYPEDLGY